MLDSMVFPSCAMNAHPFILFLLINKILLRIIACENILPYGLYFLPSSKIMFESNFDVFDR